MNVIRPVSLTGHLRSKASPLRQYFETRFPNTLALRHDFASRSGDLLVTRTEAAAGTVGTTFDVMTRLLLRHDHRPVDVPVRGLWTKNHQDATDQLTTMARNALRRGTDEEFYRACWGLGLLTEATRSMPALVRGPTGPILYQGGNPITALLDLAPEGGLRELAALRALASEKLFPELRTPLFLNPTFYVSALCKADADIIAGGALIDLKTQLGIRNSWTRVFRLHQQDVRAPARRLRAVRHRGQVPVDTHGVLLGPLREPHHLVGVGGTGSARR